MLSKSSQLTASSQLTPPDQNLQNSQQHHVTIAFPDILDKCGKIAVNTSFIIHFSRLLLLLRNIA